MKRFLSSARHAVRGISYALRHEPNLRLDVLAAVVVLAVARLMGVRVWEWLLLLIAIAFVFVVELVNTAVERLLDLLQPRLHMYARDVKDVMAGATLVAAAVALAIGVVIFVPHVL